jgi:hypothetical protein
MEATMNNFENLITLVGDKAEVLRFVDWISTGEGFNRHCLVGAEDNCAPCQQGVEFEPHCNRLVVYSHGGPVIGQLVAASRTFKLRFELSYIDFDGYIEVLAYEPENAVWTDMVVEGGSISKSSI